MTPEPTPHRHRPRLLRRGNGLLAPFARRSAYDAASPAMVSARGARSSGRWWRLFLSCVLCCDNDSPQRGRAAPEGPRSPSSKGRILDGETVFASGETAVPDGARGGRSRTKGCSKNLFATPGDLVKRAPSEPCAARPIEDKRLARSAAKARAQRSERSVETLVRIIVVRAVSRRENRERGSMSVGARGMRRGSSGKNVAPGVSTAADNSLALAVNGKRCGECQCVTMNHGNTNQAVARSGGGL